MQNYNDFRNSLKFLVVISLFLAIGIQFISGCVSTGGTAMEAHKKGMEGITQDEYIVAKKPVDRHFIGAAWSKQFGPVEDPTIGDIRVKKEKSFSGMQQDFAYNLGIAVGGQTVIGPQGEAGVQGGSIEKAKLEGVEIITPVNIADIPFEPNISYVTEALRLANFKIKEEKSNKAGINVSAGTALGSGSATAEIGSQGRRGTEGEGLVVAYKLHTIDLKNYSKQESGSLPLELDKVVDFSKANFVAKARLQIIEPGVGKSLPRNVLWACTRADAKSRDMVAAWVVDLKSTDPKRKSLTIAFPALPAIDECQNYSGVVYSRIDPVTDKIIRQKISIAVLEAELTDTLKPKTWVSRISLVDESFSIKPVAPNSLEMQVK
jgi:hypothetical protein